MTDAHRWTLDQPGARGRSRGRRAHTALGWRLAALLAGICAFTSNAAIANEFLDLSLEELLAIEIPVISGAGGQDRSASLVPSAVTVVSAEDIRRFGYRTLSEALDAERGFAITDNLNYEFVGVRGFSLSGDYNSRFLLQIDGLRVTDPVFSAAPVGTEFPLDLDLVERIEVIRGPGSSLHGSGAVLGIINVVTRRAPATTEFTVSGSLGSLDTRTGRLGFGTTLETGTELVASVSGLRSDGRGSIRFPELSGDPAMNDGWVHDADRTRARNLFLSLVHGPFSLQVIDGARRKQFGDGLYSTIFGDNRNLTRDQFQFVDVRWRQIDDESGGLTARVYQGMYRYGGTYAYDVPPVTLNVDEIRARWWGAEAQYARTLGPHHLTIGAEYVNVPGALLRNFDVNEDGSPVGCVSTATATPCLDARSGTGNAALFVQDDVRLAAHWRLAGVLRHDRPRGLGSVTSPRLSVIYSPRDSTAIKLIYGSSFRTPNLYERAFTIPGYKSSPNIRPERVRTIELVAEHSFRPNLRALGSIFEYRARDLVTAFIDPVDSQWTYGNVQSQRSRGVELELQGRARWLDVRASVSAVNTKDETTGTRPPGSSARIAKFRAGVPWHDDRWHLGMEARHASRSTAANGVGVPSRSVVNLVLSARELARGLDASVGLYNLFDRRYGDPATFDDLAAINVVPRPGRTFRVKVDYRFP